MAKIGLSSCLLLVLLAATLTWSRPQQQRGKLREVKLITEPRPGQEFVHIQSSVISQQKVGPEVDFATSHKIPGALPEEDPDDEEVEVAPVVPVKRVRVAVKSKRESEAEKILQKAILSPVEFLPIVEDVKKDEEIRMEFSVVTSKPRKEMKQSGGVKKVSPAPSDASKEIIPEVEVDSKGEFGQLDASAVGSDEKKVLSAKKQATSVKLTAGKVQEQLVKEVEVKPASQVGVTSPKVEQESGAITVPIQKQQNDGLPIATTTPLPPTPSAKNFDILPVNHITAKREDPDNEKDFDFVDSPLADKVLVPAGTNQQSRIEVKKGPNGQDYEYEYVYYYYDDDENDTTADAGDKKANTVKTSPKVTTTTSAPSTTTNRHYLPESPVHEVSDHPRGRGRVRGQASIAAELEQTVVGAQDAVNEVVPVQRGSHSRTRGRSGTTEDPSTTPVEERLPANTRFPPRSRSSHNSNSVATTTPLPTVVAQDTPITRVRGGSSVRRPSLELVDSSSFKTHSSDASRDQDLRPEFPSRLPEGPARFLGVTANEEEEPIKPRGNRLRGPSSTTPAAVEEEDVEEEDEEISDAPRRGQPSRRPTSSVKTSSNIPEDAVDETTTRVVEAGLTAAQMDIVANELYSLLQQAQAENAIGEEATPLGVAVDEEEVTTELLVQEEVTTTPAPTTQPPTTTTTTAATTTSTTTQEPSTTAGGRGRYRGNAAGSRTGTRNKFRSNGASTETRSTSTEAPVESTTRARARFGNSRVPSSNNYGNRKGFHKSTASPEDHSGDSEPEVAVSVAPATRSGGFPRNRFSATRPTRVTSTTSTPPSDDSPLSSPSSPAAKPAFADRFNSLRRRGGAKASTTSAPVAEETRSDSSGEETHDLATASEAPSTTARSQGRQRLSIGSVARPLRPGPKVNINSRGRLGPSTTTQQPSTEADDSEQTLSSSSSAQEDAQSQSDEAQEVVTTAAPDALTRLRNRPRLRVNAAKQTAASTSSPVRRPHGLLPRRRPQHAEAKEASDSDSSIHSEESESSSPSSEETSEASTEGTSSATHEPPHENRLSSLLRRRARPARPGFPRQSTQEDA